MQMVMGKCDSECLFSKESWNEDFHIVSKLMFLFFSSSKHGNLSFSAFFFFFSYLYFNLSIVFFYSIGTKDNDTQILDSHFLLLPPFSFHS